MRSLPFLAIGVMAILCGCATQAHIRADYIRATLPYESAALVKSAERMRRANPDVTAGEMSSVDQLIIEDALRLHICLSDPHISEKDKSYARNVLPMVVAYIATNNVGAGFKSGVEYEMLPGDFMFPPRMKIRDILDELIYNR
jgi:hypothetical protein